MAENIWDKFDKTFDTEGLSKDIEEVEKNGSSTRKEVPIGDYEVAVVKLELTESKKHDPMVTCWMKIVEGEYKGSFIFYNQVVTSDWQFRIANEFIRSLLSECPEAPTVHFHTFNQYGNLLMDVMELIDDSYEYNLSYGKNQKGYNTYTINEVYILED